MSSYTFTLNDNKSELEAHFYPPIELNDDYVCGLVDFQSFMTIPNVNLSNNTIYYHVKFEIQMQPKRCYTLSEISL